MCVYKEHYRKILNDLASGEGNLIIEITKNGVVSECGAITKKFGVYGTD